MLVFAYCAASFTRSVKRASGAEPATCPPVTSESFDFNCLSGNGRRPWDLLYFKLHGLPDQPYWYGDGWQTALSAQTILKADLGGAVVFVANCYLPESPMLKALLTAGAGYVIGGSGQNYALPSGIDGADLLGLWVRFFLQAGISVERAFKFAQDRLRLRHTEAARDALGFQLWKGGVV